jgi:hypothetical protein
VTNTVVEAKGFGTNKCLSFGEYWGSWGDSGHGRDISRGRRGTCECPVVTEGKGYCL